MQLGYINIDIYIYILIGALEHDLFFYSVGNVIIPTDELHHIFRGVGIPPTSIYIYMVPCPVSSHPPPTGWGGGVRCPCGGVLYIHTYLHTYLPTYLHTYVHTYIHTSIPTYQHTNIPTYQHTDIPTYQHTYHIPTNIPPPQATGGGDQKNHTTTTGHRGGGPEEPDDTVHPYPLVGGGGGVANAAPYIYIYIYISWIFERIQNKCPFPRFLPLGRISCEGAGNGHFLIIVVNFGFRAFWADLTLLCVKMCRFFWAEIPGKKAEIPGKRAEIPGQIHHDSKMKTWSGMFFLEMVIFILKWVNLQKMVRNQTKICPGKKFVTNEYTSHLFAVFSGTQFLLL